MKISSLFKSSFIASIVMKYHCLNKDNIITIEAMKHHYPYCPYCDNEILLSLKLIFETNLLLPLTTTTSVQIYS